EGHVHGLVEVARRAHLRARLLPLATLGIERAKAPATVRLEPAHAEFLSQGEGLVVMGFGGIAIPGIAPRRNVTDEAQSICLVTAFLVRTGECQRLLGEGLCLLQMAG